MHKTIANDRYGIIRPLGSGGMARVYLAHDEVLDRDVALKVLREQFAEDAESAERFRREALSGAALSHPNIVSVYDRGEENGTSYIAMEYVPGGSLKERIEQHGPLDSGVAASIALQITEALRVAHDRGVIHRDIKPQNILLTPSGKAKVTDFGIARAASSATISQTGLVLGTASYMSPEQAMGESVTPRSDLYSLGVVLYEMLTGELPYTAENPLAVSMKHVNEPPRPPKAVNPRIPDGMNAVVMKLLAKAPEDRYGDTTELAGDLRRAREGLPPIAAGLVDDNTETTLTATQPTVPVPPAVTPWRDRKKVPRLLAAIPVLLILLGSGWALSQGLWDLDSLLGGIGQSAGVEVPDVEGLAEEQAREKLTDAGFEVDVQRPESSAADAGKVVGQSPAAGERADKGSRVVIEVGDGPSMAKVPDVVGLSLPEAKAALDKANLTVGLLREIPSDTAAEGVVVEQGYRAGTGVEAGTSVNLGISSGPPQNAAPAPVAGEDAIEEQQEAIEDAIEEQQDAREDQEDNSGPGSSDSGDGGD